MSQLQSALVPDGYELIGDEYVRKIPLLLEREIEKHIETNIPSFFNKIGYKIKKGSKNGNIWKWAISLFAQVLASQVKKDVTCCSICKLLSMRET